MIGTVWETDTWDANAWEDNTWADAIISAVRVFLSPLRGLWGPL
jgi:hypothetical protein